MSRYTKFYFIALALFSVNAYAESTVFQDLEQVYVDGSGTPAHYYFVNLGSGWGAAGCPTAHSAYIAETATGAKAMLSLALIAQSTGRLVKFKGTCDSSGSYIQVNHIILKQTK